MRTKILSENNLLFFSISLFFAIKCFWPTYYSQFFSLAYFQKLRLSSFQENDLYWHKSAFMRTKILSKNNSLFFSISLIFVIKSFWPTYYSQLFSLTYFQKLRINRFQENDLYWYKSAFMRTNIFSDNNSLFFSISLILVIKSFRPTYYSQFFSLTYFQKLRLSSFQENDLYWHKSAFMRTNNMSKNNSLLF